MNGIGLEFIPVIAELVEIFVENRLDQSALDRVKFRCDFHPPAIEKFQRRRRRTVTFFYLRRYLGPLGLKILCSINSQPWISQSIPQQQCLRAKVAVQNQWRFLGQNGQEFGEPDTLSNSQSLCRAKCASRLRHFICPTAEDSCRWMSDSRKNKRVFRRNPQCLPQANFRDSIILMNISNAFPVNFKTRKQCGSDGRISRFWNWDINNVARGGIQ